MNFKSLLKSRIFSRKGHLTKVLSFFFAVSYNLVIAQSLQYSFHSSGVYGAGGQNIVAFDPFNEGRILAGGDMNGFHYSNNGGNTWIPSDKGLYGHNKLSIASIVFSRTVSDLVYAGVGGTGGEGGGFLRSIDGGLTWEVLSESIRFSGKKNRSILTTGAQRLPSSTGKLIELDENEGIIYAATLSQGLFVSNDGGYNWNYIALKGKWLRTLALIPGTSKLYVGTFQEDMYEVNINLNNLTGTATKVTGSPNIAEGLFYDISNEALWVAAGPYGIMKMDNQGNWTTKLAGTNSLVSGPFWYSIAISGNKILAGCVAPEYDNSNNNYRCLVLSTDYGDIWSNALSGVSNNVFGTTETWWKDDYRSMIQGTPFNGVTILGRSMGRGSDIAFDPFNPNRILVASNGGFYLSQNGGTEWKFASNGKQLVASTALKISPWGEVFYGMKDWGYVIGNNLGDSVEKWNRYDNAMMMGTDFAFDATDLKFYSVVSPNDTGGGYIIKGSKHNNNLEILLDIKNLIGSTNGRPIKICVGYNNQDTITFLTIVPDNDASNNTVHGIYRSVNGGQWTRISDTYTQSILSAPPYSNRKYEFNVDMVWSGGSMPLYIYCQKTGLWRGNNGGTGRWEKILNMPSIINMYSGFMTVSPLNPNHLYISTDSGLFSVKEAHLSNPIIEKVDLGDDYVTGPVAIDNNGNLFIAIPASPFYNAKLLLVDTLGNVSDLSDDYYRKSSLFPIAIDIEDDGRIIIANRAKGYTVGVPSTNTSINSDFGKIPAHKIDMIIYPNPFNSITTISWQSEVSDHKSLVIYDIMGKKVITLVNEFKNKGSYNEVFDGKDLPSGIYFCKLQVGQNISKVQMMLMNKGI